MQDVEMSHDWARIQRGLDEALGQLGQTDRDAVLLRFFEQCSLKDVGSALGMEEDTARKRVSRALEKLRLLLARQGITTTNDALSSALSTHAVQIAPAGLAAGILATSLTAGSAAAATGATTFAEFLTMTTKLKATIAVVAVAATVGTPLYLQHAENKTLRRQNQALLAQGSQFAALQAENEQLANRLAIAANAPIPDKQRVELNRLRGEVARLRGEANEAQQLRQEINRVRSGQGTAVAGGNPNSDTLLAYLGEAVPPPPNMDPAYNTEGLLAAIQQAAQVAGISVKKVEFDTSEFPFLAAVACNDADFQKLIAQFKNMPAYEYGGAASGKGIYTLNITHHQSYPSEAFERIRRRTQTRMQVFLNQIGGRQEQ